MSVNIFTDAVGSRIILTYESDLKEPKVPPLPDTGPPLAGLAANSTDAESPAAPVEQTTIDVSHDSGTATVTIGAKKYVFKHATAYRTKQDADRTRIVFSDRAFPLAKLQNLLAKEDNVDIGDVFPLDFPEYISISLDDYFGFSFSAGGMGIGNSIENPINDIKEENGRVRGTLKMREPQEVFDEAFRIEATIDAAVLTPHTKLGGAAATPQVAARKSPFGDDDVLLPEGTGNIQGEGSQLFQDDPRRSRSARTSSRQVLSRRTREERLERTAGQ